MTKLLSLLRSYSHMYNLNHFKLPKVILAVSLLSLVNGVIFFAGTEFYNPDRILPEVSSS